MYVFFNPSTGYAVFGMSKIARKGSLDNSEYFSRVFKLMRGYVEQVFPLGKQVKLRNRYF